LAFPLGWLEPPSYQYTLELVRHPVTRLILFAFCVLSLFHWAHRFRYTLYDGLQIKHLNEVIFVVCYGGAVVGTIVAGSILWNIP
jgi:fumarate reductase subunit D